MPFRGFADVWTPLVPARDVRNKPVRVALAGEALVLFRDGQGRPGALIDRCPHRGVALSLGRVAADGCLECPFHGWRFDVTGANRGVPLNPEARLETLGAQALPTREVGGLIWVYTRPGAVEPPEPAIPPALVDPDLARTVVRRDWACHWTRAMENMLDGQHLPFVHRRTIGRSLRRRMRPDSRMDVSWEDTGFGGRILAALDGRDGGSLLEFYRPNIMVLHIPIPRRRLRLHALVVPAETGRTRLMVVAVRDFARSPLLEPLFAWMNGRIVDEDQAVVESSGPEECPPAAEERSVATDRATLQFRRYYYGVLRGSGA
ncbi:MAG: aromatic ring-hydroxylating dioxygenase subunit alpha [Phenylobacterium sp.]|uniref:aromatic ring-hydroxylating oxygenase subunit alpha n=1 Tax=Phenylobacterium sp. TaxID=1871053 RepID=UPI001A420766|nr:aromatic ring-hydroxylating dioxygenase subunit alpha [Phenylobacterium sp.]MBL8771388.1 aromatic ring-hydroxylating dioxygenase subunit alpha [Phenylobacterium sp.]